MKYLVLLAVLFVAYLAWSHGRRRDMAQRSAPGPAAAPPAAPAPQDMVRCPVCALHLPRTDALPGPSGAFYCSDEHRRQRER